MSRRVLYYGDSNTYGYDPRSYLGGRYPESIRWTALLKKYGWEICNMERFLAALLHADDWERSRKILLIAPPPMTLGAWVSNAETIAASCRLAGCYEDTAQRLDIAFADAGGWRIGFTFGGVHFSEAGHLAFAKEIDQTLSALFSI